MHPISTLPLGLLLLCIPQAVLSAPANLNAGSDHKVESRTNKNAASMPFKHACTSNFRAGAMAMMTAGGGAKAQLTKPAIKPAFSEKVQGLHLEQDLAHHSWVYKEWPRAWIPEQCLYEARYNGYVGDEFEVRDIWYSDCKASWTVCRHVDAGSESSSSSESWESITRTLGQVPVGMRQFVSNLVILPDSIGNKKGTAAADKALAGAAAYTRGSVMAYSPSYFKLGVLIHEFTHILDKMALRDEVEKQGYPAGTHFSETPAWEAAYRNDTAVPTPYSRVALPEDFADAGRWAISSITHEGGLDAYSSGWRGCEAQIETYKRFLAHIIYPPSGSCTDKIDTSKPVPVPIRSPADAGDKKASSSLHDDVGGRAHA